MVIFQNLKICDPAWVGCLEVQCFQALSQQILELVFYSQYLKTMDQIALSPWWSHRAGSWFLRSEECWLRALWQSPQNLLRWILEVAVSLVPYFSAPAMMFLFVWMSLSSIPRFFCVSGHTGNWHYTENCITCVKYLKPSGVQHRPDSPYSWEQPHLLQRSFLPENLSGRVQVKHLNTAVGFAIASCVQTSLSGAFIQVDFSSGPVEGKAGMVVVYD